MSQFPTMGRPSIPASYDVSWGEIEPSLLEEKRGSVPAFPIDLVPSPWREWAGDTARSAGAPVDYVVQAVLASVAAIGGAGVTVRIAPGWSEPLVLWQILVGRASSGKSPALAAARKVLVKPVSEGGQSRAGIVVDNHSIEAVIDAVAAHPRGVVLWHDDPSDWLARIACCERIRKEDQAEVLCAWLQAWSAGPVIHSHAKGRLEKFPVSILGSIQPDRLAKALQRDELAARLLYAWPHQPTYAPLADRKAPSDDQMVLLLRKIERQVGDHERPLILAFDEAGIKVLDDFLGSLHANLRDAEGLEAAWLGKGRGTVARLAAVLELLDWAAADIGPSRRIGAAPVERAVSLWRDYFWPHARAVFQHGTPNDQERLARRVARWLRTNGLAEVSREQVRCEALGRRVNASGVDGVMYHLQVGGIVQRAESDSSPQRGRPAVRWKVHPGLAAA